MKKKIGILKGRVVIEGDKNLQTTNEIHIKDLENKQGGGEEVEQYLYYKLDTTEIYEKENLFGNISEQFVTALECLKNTYIVSVIRGGKEIKAVLDRDPSDAYALQMPFVAEYIVIMLSPKSKYAYFKLYKNYNVIVPDAYGEIIEILNISGTICEQIFTSCGIIEEAQKALVREVMDKYVTQITKEEYESQIVK